MSVEREVIEMIQALLEMSTDTYIKCKIIFREVCREHLEDKRFFDLLFELIDQKRPLLIEMK